MMFLYMFMSYVYVHLQVSVFFTFTCMTIWFRVCVVSVYEYADMCVDVYHHVYH